MHEKKRVRDCKKSGSSTFLKRCYKKDKAESKPNSQLPKTCANYDRERGMKTEKY